MTNQSPLPAPCGRRALTLGLLLASSLVGCLSSSKDPSPAGPGSVDVGSGGGSGGSAGGGPTTCRSSAIFTFDASEMADPEGIIADANGLVFSIEGDPRVPGSSTITPRLMSMPAGGTPVTIYSGTPPILAMYAVDATNAYVTDVGGVFAVPRGGGAKTTVSSTMGGSLVVDATNVYAINLETIQSTPKAGGTTTTIYTTPSGTDLDSMVIDGSQLYWSETDNAQNVTLQTATVATKLVPTKVVSLPAGKTLSSMAVRDGTVVFTLFDPHAIQFDEALYAVDATAATPATRTVVANDAGGPLVLVNQQIYYRSFGSVWRVGLDGSARENVTPNDDEVTTFGVDPKGTVYYAAGPCIYRTP
jgi:hypothetical protein